jgi:hypothetical protein
MIHRIHRGEKDHRLTIRDSAFCRRGVEGSLEKGKLRAWEG